MSQITEILEEKIPVLIVAKKNYQLVNFLKRELKKYKAEVFLSPHLPNDLKRFAYCFLIGEDNLPKKNYFPPEKKIIFIFINNHRQAQLATKYYQDSLVKVISIAGDKITQQLVDKALWFSFSQTKESVLRLTTLKIGGVKKIKQFNLKFKTFSRKKLIYLVVNIFLFLHLAFFLPLFSSTYFLYRSAEFFKQENFSQTSQYASYGKTLSIIAKKLYIIPRSTYLFFSLTFSEDFFDINEKGYITLEKLLSLQQNLKQALSLILKVDKNVEEKQILSLRFNILKKDFAEIEKNLNVLKQKINQYLPLAKNLKNDFSTITGYISRFKPLLPHIDSLLGKDSPKTYLLLFANNMELRPGGGFIGSFGLLQVKDYAIEKITIYDVYDADGQLVAHVDPPEAIRKYLSQPNWFLRDSAFSPDFLENYIRAKFFLEKEMNFKNFSGSILLTTSAVQNILGAFSEIYLADFKEKINQNNFYLKTQYYSEKNFFPGSIQKKDFLGSLTKSLLVNLENASVLNLAKEIKKSFDEKQMVVYFDNPPLQKIIDSFYWSGRTIEAKCATQLEYCLSDFLFPYDANLGLNKVNFFINRSFVLKIKIDNQGKINQTFSVQFNNDSYDVYPGGAYKNYFQILIPLEAELKNITLDGVEVEDFDETNDKYKKLGLLIELKPKNITELKINYTLGQKIQKGKNVYQLITQKQIGASNSDLVIQLDLPRSIKLVNQNFPALVKDNQIIYNTTLLTDKIFFVELIKD